MKKIIAMFLVCVGLLNITPQYLHAATEEFSDVPKEHWAYEYVVKLKELGVTSGVGDNRFAPDRTITWGEFTTFLNRLIKPEDIAVDAEPNDVITTAEIAVELIRCMGYDDMATRMSHGDSSGYIAIAADMGIIVEDEGEGFIPSASVTRGQAAAMLMRAYYAMENKINFINGFYAIRSSGQIGVIGSMDSVSFGWCRLERGSGGLSINASSTDGNEYRLPQGYDAPFRAAADKTRLLMIAVRDADSVAIISDVALRGSAVQLITKAVNGGIIQENLLDAPAFDGVVVDFETLKGEQTRADFNDFLAKLRTELDKYNKLIYVAVHPSRSGGHVYFDGYDYRTIGRLADKVILMAHDYNAKVLTAEEMERGVVMTPLTPIDEVYAALKAVTDKNTGVEDKEKILLQLSFATAQWKTQDGAVINNKPYTPDYDALYSRLRTGAQIQYSEEYENPYAVYQNDSDGTRNVIWYEDARSVAAKLKLAESFGITGVSLWRLGTIPDYDADLYLNVLEEIL